MRRCKEKLLSILLCAALLASLVAPACAAALPPEEQDSTVTATVPDGEPGAEPSGEPGAEPSREPGAEPSREPGAEPSQEPGAEPSQEPGAEPSQEPGAEHSQEPGAGPSDVLEPAPQPKPISESCENCGEDVVHSESETCPVDAVTAALSVINVKTEDDLAALSSEELQTLLGQVQTALAACEAAKVGASEQALAAISILIEPYEAMPDAITTLLATPKLEGKGTEGAPYQVGTAEDFKELARAVAAGGTGFHLELTTDITLDDSWTPIGTHEKPFTGTLSAVKTASVMLLSGESTADTYVVSGLTSPLFGSTNDAEFIGITVEGTVTGEADVGALVAEAVNTTFTNCVNKASVSDGTNVGGLAGKVSGTTVFDGCVNGGAVTATGGNANAGGLVGLAGGAVTLKGAISLTGAVTANTANAGGVAGMATEGLINETTALTIGDVTGGNVGGLAGKVQGTGSQPLTVNHFSLTELGTLSGTTVGGIVGTVENQVTLRDCYVTTAHTAAGALVGHSDGSGLILESCFSYLMTDGKVTDLPLVGSGTATYTNSFRLVAAPSPAVENPDAPAEPGADTTAKTAAEFADGTVAHALGDAYGLKLGTDKYPGYVGESHPAVYTLTLQAKGPVPLTADGKATVVITGAAAGVSYTVAEGVAYANEGTMVTLTVTGLEKDEALVFDPADRVTVTPPTEGDPSAAATYTVTVGSEDESITYEIRIQVAPDTSWYTDGETEFHLADEADLMGLAKLVSEGKTFEGKTLKLTADIELVSVTPVTIGTKEKPFTGTFDAAKSEGAWVISNVTAPLFGYAKDAALNDLIVAGNIEDANAGALGAIAAEAENTSFTGCVNRASVSGKANVGGIVGSASGAITLTHCSNEGAVTGTGTGTGGIVGNLAANAVYAIQNCTNTAAVKGAASTGGVVGQTGNSTADKPGRLENCVNSGTLDGASNVGGVAGKTGNYLTVQTCSNSGTVTTTGVTGGVIGATGTYTNLVGCSNSGELKAGNGNTGGVVGTLGGNGWLENCHNEGAITSVGTNVGGVAGSTSSMTAPVTGVYNTGNVSGSGNSANVGGVIGNFAVAGQTITGAHNTGSITGSGTSSQTGGVFGNVADGNNDSITECWNEGTVTGSGKYTGGVAGFVKGTFSSYLSGTKFSRLNRCWNLGEVAGEGTGTKTGGISGGNSAIYAYAVDCFNYGAVTALSAANLGAVSGENPELNQNCYYLSASSAKSRTLAFLSGEEQEEVSYMDADFAAAGTAADFASGKIAYGLDHGGTSKRTTFWGQGGLYPVLADGEDYFPVYALELTVDGPEEGFLPNPPAESAEPSEPAPVNGVQHNGTNAPLTLYLTSGTHITAWYTLKEGYLLQEITVTLADGSTGAVTLDPVNKTVGFTTPEAMDAAILATFVKAPTDLEKQFFTVTFDANGGVFEDEALTQNKEVQGGGQVKLPEPPPNRTGAYDIVDDPIKEFTFSGWYTDPACTRPFNVTTSILGSMTLYAGWKEAAKLTVTLDANGGVLADGTEAESILLEGRKLVQPVAPVREGYEFRGWCLDAKGVSAYDFTKPVTGALTLYAHWVKEGKCVVTFQANGGYFLDGDKKTATLTVEVEKGQRVTRPEAYRAAVNFKKYELENWYQGENAWDFTAPVTGDMTLTAQWTESDDLDGGYFEIPDLETLEAFRDAVNTFNVTTPAYAGKTFVLTTDIELPANWKAIGPYNPGRPNSAGFAGTFDGGGHTVTLNPKQTQTFFGGTIENVNIECERSNSIIAGLAWGMCSAYSPDDTTATIRNCTVKAELSNANSGFIYMFRGGQFIDCTLKAGSVISGGDGVAGLAAECSGMEGNLFQNCVVEEGVVLTGQGNALSAHGGLGGLTAYGGGVMKNCSVGADLTADGSKAYVGGLIGMGNSVANAQITNCAFTGTITIRSGYAGGLVGGAQGYGIQMENCYSTSTIVVTGDATVGGLVSGASAGSGSSYLRNSYFYGDIQTPAAICGKVGALSGPISNTANFMEDCYYCVKSAPDMAPGVEGTNLTYLPAADFQSGKAANLLDTDSGSRENVWTHSPEKGYPVLGEPTFYHLSMTVVGEGGSASIDGKTDLYWGAGNEVTVDVTLNRYENTKYGPQYEYQVTSVTVNGEEADEYFDMPAEEAEAVVTIELVQTGDIPEPEPEPAPDPKPGDGGGTGTGSGSGIGDGDGAGNGEGPGENPGEGEGAGDVGGEDTGKTELPTGTGGSEETISPEPPASIEPAPQPQPPEVIAPAISKEIQVEDPAEEAPKEDLPAEEPQGGSQQGGSEAPEERDETEVELTFFEVVQKTVKENPLVAVGTLTALLAIALYAGMTRYRKFKKER